MSKKHAEKVFNYLHNLFEYRLYLPLLEYIMIYFVQASVTFLMPQMNLSSTAWNMHIEGILCLQFVHLLSLYLYIFYLCICTSFVSIFVHLLSLYLYIFCLCICTSFVSEFVHLLSLYLYIFCPCISTFFVYGSLLARPLLTRV